MKRVVVVGGGIAGIVSALLLNRKFDQVFLIERQSRIGGLLNSVRNDQGLWFDYGSHFLRETGIEALDKLLFGGINPEDWCILENLKGGGYYASRFNERTPFLDARSLPDDVYRAGMMQLLELCGPSRTFANLDEQLRGTFGDILTDNLFKPILVEKFYGCDLRDLAVDAHHLFGLSRIIGFNAETVRELKKSEVLDGKLAYHSFLEGYSNMRNFYPVDGGAGKWIEFLSGQLSRSGVEVLLNGSVDEIVHGDHEITSVVLSDGRKLDCDHLVWTIPVFHCIRAGKLNDKSDMSSAPRRLITSLHHFAFDKPFLTKVHYVQCHEPGFSAFRITLYPNIQMRPATDYHLTVEVISRETPDLGRVQERVLQELSTMNIVPEGAAVRYRKSELVQEGFPMPTHAFTKSCREQLAFVENQWKNATFLGKGTGRQFLMQDVLVNVFREISALNESMEKSGAGMTSIPE